MKKKKINWAQRFDSYTEAKISKLLANKTKLPGLKPETEAEILNFIKNAAVFDKKAVIRQRQPGLIFRQNKLMKLAAAAALMVLVAAVFLIKYIPITPGKAEFFLVQSVQGDAYYQEQRGNKQAIPPGHVIMDDTILLTGRASRLSIGKGDAIKIELSENARLKIEDGGEDTSLFLYAGTVLAEVSPDRLPNHLRIRTRLCDVRVTGTQFSVTAGENDFSVVSVQQGTVAVSINYDFSAELDILAAKNADYGAETRAMLAEEIKIASKQSLAVDNKTFTENENDIKGLLNELIAYAGKKTPDENKAKEIMTKIEEKKTKNVQTNKTEMLGTGESRALATENSKPEPLSAEEEKPAGIKEEAVAEMQGKIADRGIDLEGCVGEWLFSGNVDDTSGFANHGQIAGAQLTKDRFGNENSAFFFNGQSYILIKDNKVLKEIEKSDVFSISVWVKVKNWHQGFFPIIDKYSSPNRFGYGLDLKTADRISFFAGEYNRYECYAVFVPGPWYHLVFVSDRENNKFYFYIDGKKIKEEKGYFDISTNSDFYVGYSPSGDKEFAIGVIDDLRLFNKALTADEVSRLYGENGANRTTQE